MNDIVKARSDADIAAVTELAWEFVDFLRTRYPERLEDLELYLKKQRFTEMLANFRDHFNPPKGECFLARLDDRAMPRCGWGRWTAMSRRCRFIARLDLRLFLLGEGRRTMVSFICG